MHRGWHTYQMDWRFWRRNISPSGVPTGIMTDWDDTTLTTEDPWCWFFAPFPSSPASLTGITSSGPLLPSRCHDRPFVTYKWGVVPVALDLYVRYCCDIPLLPMRRSDLWVHPSEPQFTLFEWWTKVAKRTVIIRQNIVRVICVQVNSSEQNLCSTSIETRANMFLKTCKF
jgi:hypothetical protein